MEFSKMKKDGKYTIISGIYKNFTVERKTNGNTATYVIGTEKDVFERNEKLYLEIEKPKRAALTEEDIFKKLTEIIVSDALEGMYDSLPAVPTNYWFKKMLPDFIYQEAKRQKQTKTVVDADKKMDTLFGTIETVRHITKPTPYEKPSVEKVL